MSSIKRGCRISINYIQKNALEKLNFILKYICKNQVTFNPVIPFPKYFFFSLRFNILYNLTLMVIFIQFCFYFKCSK